MGIPRQQREYKLAGWGEIEFSCKTLKNRTVELFHGKTDSDGSSVIWLPEKSVLLLDSMETLDEYALEEIRDRAYEKAFSEIEAGILDNSDCGCEFCTDQANVE